MIERHATLVVLAWNRWDLTRRCLDSLRQTDLSGADVIVVDNGSTDETPQALVPYTSWLRVIRNSRNLGFVGGNNVAIGEADPDSDVVLLNN
ncbi:MAG TPA: glycosyltransferase, partial [Thermoanaerobaculia bacterium]|nr:glycosyltransferase [Thermoanaerobaculia bacterium]